MSLQASLEHILTLLKAEAGSVYCGLVMLRVNILEIVGEAVIILS